MFVYLKQTWSDHNQRRWRGKKTYSMPDSWKDKLPPSALIVDDIDYRPNNRKPLRAGVGRTKPNFADYMRSTDPKYDTEAVAVQAEDDKAEAEVTDLATAQMENAAEATENASEVVRKQKIANARKVNLEKARAKRKENLKREKQANV